MVDILHRIGIQSSPDEVYAALTSADRLAGWWTTDTQGVGKDAGGVLKFRFGNAGGFDMKVLELNPDNRVLWEVVDGPEEWIATHVDWQLSQADGYTIVLFKHEGWKEPVEFMHHCSTRWATFLMSMKSLLETGEGAPYPHEVEVSNWT